MAAAARAPDSRNGSHTARELCGADAAGAAADTGRPGVWPASALHHHHGRRHDWATVWSPSA